MFPKLFHYPRRSPSPSAHGAVRPHDMSVLDQVARGLNQLEATTGHSPYLCGPPQSLQNLIDAQVVQYSPLFEACPSDEMLPSSSQVKEAEQMPIYDACASAVLYSSAIPNDTFRPVFSEQHSPVSVPSLSRGSSTTPPAMAATPVEGSYAGPPDSFIAEMMFGNMLGHDGASIEDDPLFKALAAEDTALTSAAPRPTASAVSHAFNDGSSQHVVLHQPVQDPSWNPRNSSEFPPESNDFWGGMQAYNEPANGPFSMTSAPDAPYVDYEEQNASSHALPVQRFIDPDLLQAVPPSYPSLSGGVAINVVDTVLPTPPSTETNVRRASSASRKRKRADAPILHQASAVSAERPPRRGKADKKPEHKLVRTDGRPASTLALDQIRVALGLRAVHPPGVKFECPVPGCTRLMVEPELLDHFKAHSGRSRPNPCPVPGCSRTLSDAAALGRHVRDAHLRAQALKCSACNGKINRNAGDQIRRHLTAGKHEDVWRLLCLRLVRDDIVSAAETIDGQATAHGNIEDDKEEGSSNGVKRQRCS